MIIVDFSDGRVPTPRPPPPLVLNGLNRLRVAVAAGWIDKGLKGTVIAATVLAVGVGTGIVAWTIGLVSSLLYGSDSSGYVERAVWSVIGSVGGIGVVA